MGLEVLREIGLSEREIKVYLALLEIGPNTAGPIIKKSSVPNSKIYEILEKLIDKGLVTYVIKANRKNFQAQEPKNLLYMLEEKKKRVQEIIPELEEKQKLYTEKQSVEILEGRKAIFTFLTKLIEEARKGEEYLSFSLGKEHKHKEVYLFYKNIGLRRYEKGLNVKILANKKIKNLFEKVVYADRKNGIKDIKYTNFNFPQGITIFKDKIITLAWEKKPTAIVVTSKQLAEKYKKFFEELWSKAKK